MYVSDFVPDASFLESHDHNHDTFGTGNTLARLKVV